MPINPSKNSCIPVGHILFMPIVCLALSAPGHGQTNDAGQATGNDSPGNLEEVIVTSRYTTNERLDTATGLGLTLHETPQSVSVMTAQRITDQNLESLTDIVKNAPGVSAKAQDSSRYTFSARGFDINNYQIDGVPVYWQPGNNAGETQSDTSLYERIEVVRGATGLLTGAGNPSASINLVRKHANSDVLTGNVSISAGSWNTYSVTTDVSTPLSAGGSVRGRVVAHHLQGDYFRDLAEEKKTVLYGVIDADLTDSTLLRVGASRQENEPTASTWGGLPAWYDDGTRTDWDRDKTIAADWTSWSSTVENYYLDLIQDFAQGWSAKLSINNNVNASDQMLVYLSGTPNRTTGLGMSASPRKAETEREQTSYSLNVNGLYSLFGREHELTFGAVDHTEDNVAYSHDRTNIAGVGNFNEWDGSYPQPTWGAKNQDIDLETKQFGFYGATRLSLTDGLKVILGSRLASWEQEGMYYGGNLDYGDDNVFIPYTGVLYDITTNHTVYASYTEIFKPQNNRDRNNDLLDPIIGKSKELGLKSRFFNDTLHTSVAIFSILEDNLAQEDGAPVMVNGSPVQYYREAEGAESEGYELEVVGELLKGWDLSVSYTNFDVEDANGDAVNTDHPHELLKLYTTYRFTGFLEDLTIAGGVNWQGRNYTDTTNPVTSQDEQLEQEAYSLVSIMARYQVTPDLAAQLNIDNLLDEEYYSQIGFYNQLEYGEPRNFTASLNYRF